MSKTNQPEINFSSEKIKSKYNDLVSMMKDDKSRYFYIADKEKIQRIIDQQGNVDDRGNYLSWKVEELKELMNLLESEEDRTGFNFKK